ncbi:unnamed protein product [Acanthoscelides obtectus]|uniref:Lipase domain-containing protein n=1 Tax=Acanthoscelides obtectus TaxID=200917 RepID=A0A9P0P8P0_ACAOB|nr:unnamed protein product [Acanthoscelides obtectus]CAK1662870.1 Lipase member H [Acanthoscelides obtectus]
MLHFCPPIFHIQNFSLVLYPVDKLKCPIIDKHRDVIFNLHTRLNPVEPQILEIGNDDLLATSNIDFRNPTVLFFHGFTESPKAGDYQAMRLSFLQRGNYNIILANSERLLAGLYYPDAVVNCKFIGKYGALFVDYLVHRGLNLADLHVIGFSLGAQIAGFVGQYLTTGKLPRITGLDPAGPLYNHVPPSLRLDPTDAEFVDIVHSSAALFGYKYPCGHVDFWPNGGGPKQPGCSFVERTQNGSLNELVFCEHYRSYRLFARTVTDPHRYLASRCSSYAKYLTGACSFNDRVFLGMDVDRRARGNYYIYTGLDANS